MFQCMQGTYLCSLFTAENPQLPLTSVGVRGAQNHIASTPKATNSTVNTFKYAPSLHFITYCLTNFPSHPANRTESLVARSSFSLVELLLFLSICQATVQSALQVHSTVFLFFCYASEHDHTCSFEHWLVKIATRTNFVL